MRKLALAILIFLCAVTTNAQLATVTVTNTPGNSIPSSFGGITTDVFDAQSYIPNPLYPKLIGNLVFPGQSFLMNVEGDESPWTGTPTSGDIGTFNTLYSTLQSSGITFQFSLPAPMCPTATPTTDATPAVAAYIAHAGAGWNGVTLGNEPDGACNGSGGYAGGYSGFKTNWDAFATAINGLSGGSSLKFIGPSFGGQQTWVYTSSDLNSFVNSEASKLTYASQHWYTQNGCSGSPTLAAELTAAAAKPQDFTLTSGTWNYVANAHTAGTTLRISEMNDVDCGGVSGISNTFAAALWLPDALFNLANVGTDGVNVFSDEGDQYDLVGFPSTSGCTINVTSGCFVRPNYYGFLIFQEATQNSAKFLPVSNTTSANVSVWATKDASNVIRVLVLNKDQSNSGTVNITLSGYSTGVLKTLTCSAVTCTTGVSYAGQTFDGSTTGSITGTYSPTNLTPSANVYSFSMGTTSAALLVLAPTSSTPIAPARVIFGKVRDEKNTNSTISVASR
jgi:hypothetical protein